MKNMDLSCKCVYTYKCVTDIRGGHPDTEGRIRILEFVIQIPRGGIRIPETLWPRNARTETPWKVYKLTILHHSERKLGKTSPKLIRVNIRMIKD